MTDFEKLRDIIDKAGYLCQFPGTMARIVIENGFVYQKWTPVAECLPENAKEVLVCTKSDYYGTRKVRKARCYDGEWHGQGGHFYNVTHWMPMPEPPMEE